MIKYFEQEDKSINLSTRGFSVCGGGINQSPDIVSSCF